jgi:hypothetical protein
MKSSSGKTKITLCKRLGNDWQNLADYFDISVSERSQFKQGRECQAIWEWLKKKNRFQELPEALEFLERDDLLSVLQEFSQPISPDEIHELKQILKSVNISDEQARAFYEQLSDNSTLPKYLQGGLFIFLLDYLAKKSCTPRDNKAPLLEFLERCNFLIDEPVQAKLREWKNRVALNLGIDLDAIRAKIKPTHSPEKIQTVPVLLIKIEPNLVNEEVFKVKAWLFKNKEWKPQQIEEKNYINNEFNAFIKKFLNQVIIKLGTAKHLTVEIILPLKWFDWNINELPFQQGKTEVSLCRNFPLVIRSLERLYEDDYVYPRSLLESKWNDELCATRLLTDAEAHWICCEHDYCKTTLENLEPTKVLLALIPFANERDKMFDSLNTMLDAGIPFAFWALQEPKQVENLREQISRLLKQYAPENWLEKILQCRKQDLESCWHNINLLWDNPNRLPPDIDYLLEAPE